MMGDALKLHSLLGHWFPWLHFPLRPGFRQPNETLQICKLQIIYLQRYDFLLSSPCMVRYFHQTSPTSNSENHQHHSTGTAHHRHNIVHRWVPYIRFIRFWSWCWFIALWWMPPPTATASMARKRHFASITRGLFLSFQQVQDFPSDSISTSLKKKFLKISYISYTAPRNLQY